MKILLRLKKLVRIFVTLSVVFFMLFSQWFSFPFIPPIQEVQANPGTEIKTVEFFVSQYTNGMNAISSLAGIDGGTYNLTPWVTFTIDLPEDSITVRRAIIQWTTVTQGKAVDVIDIDWQFRKTGEGTFFDDDDTDAPDYTLGVDVGGKIEGQYTFFFDVTPRVVAGSNTYEFDAQLEGPSRTLDMVKIFVTYEYDDTSTTQVKTVRYMVGCEESKTVTSDTTTSFVASDFDIYTVNPNLKEASITIESHWIEYEASAISDGSAKVDSQYRVDYTGDDSEETGGIGWANNGNTSKGNMHMLIYEELGNTNINLTSNNTIKLGMSSAVALASGYASALCAEWVITYSFDNSSTTDDDENHTRTVRYFMGVLSGCATTNCLLPTSMTEIGTKNIYIPEDGVDGNFKSVWVRYNFGFSSNKTNETFTPKMTIDADGDAYTSTGTAFTFYAQKKNSNPAVALFDVTSFMNTNWDDGDDIKIEAQSSTVDIANYIFFDVPWAELIVTYEFNAETNTSDDIKTVYWWMDNATQGRGSDFSETIDSWNRTFDTFIPESGTKTWRSSAVIAKLNRGNSDGMTLSTITYTITVDDTGVGGADTQSAAAVVDAKVDTYHWFALGTDTQIPATFGAQTDINFDITFDSYVVGDVSIEIMPSAIAYTTYQYDGPEVGGGGGGSPTFTQTTYLWYVDNDSTNPTEIWGTPNLAENTAITIIPAGKDPPSAVQELRLRINMTVNTNPLEVSTQQFQIQFKAGTDASCTSGSWVDVGALGSSAWQFATSNVTDGADITAVLSTTTSNKGEEYSKANLTQVNHVAATAGQVIEYDFHVIGSGSDFVTARQYSFRVIESDNTVFDAYTNCPTLKTEPGMANLMRHGNLFSDQIEQGFFWAN